MNKMGNLQKVYCYKEFYIKTPLSGSTVCFVNLLDDNTEIEGVLIKVGVYEAYDEGNLGVFLKTDFNEGHIHFNRLQFDPFFCSIDEYRDKQIDRLLKLN